MLNIITKEVPIEEELKDIPSKPIKLGILENN